MNSALEAILVGVLKDLGGQAYVAQIRNRMREQGRHAPSEETLLRIGRQSARIREVGPGRLALLSHLGQDPPQSAPIAEDLEPETSLALSHLAAIRNRSYICFDLETTGTDPSSEAIIQVGALKVERGIVIETFFEPVHPGDCTLPALLRKVLRIEPDGVMDRLIQAAGPWERVAPRFFEFVGDLPLVAHNACQLDLPFLQTRGLDPSHPVVDSLELSWLVLPHLERHDLEYLAELMGYPEGCAEVAALIRSESRLTGVGHHNALYDAAVLHLVLMALLDRLEEQLQDPYRGLIYRALLHDVLGERSVVLDQTMLIPLLTPKGFPQPGQGPTAGRVNSASEDSVETAFRGFVRASGRQWRAGQGEMVRLVARTLNEGGTRLIEAPTGTGKSLALAFPAVQHALATGRRVLLTTYTRNLQDQLEGDLRKLDEGDHPFRFAVLKGRGNYLCVRSLVNQALDASAAAGPVTLSTRYVLACLLGWAAAQARDGREGSLDEFPFGLRERLATARRLVDAVRAERGRCDGQLCKDTAGCFRTLARARAIASDVVVINHALWLSPALGDFPEFAGVLIDEAHELEDAATSAWTEEVSRSNLRTLLDEILAPGDREGLLPRIVRRTRPGGAVREATRRPFAAIRQVRGETVAFGRSLASFLASTGRDPRSEYGATCRLRAEGRREFPARWPALERAWRLLDAAMADVEAGLQSLATAIDEEPEDGVSEAEVVLLANRIRDARRTLSSGFGRPDPAWVT
jgi:DNA polymerase-3 subunit epsilon/ATP-dependent DNA helicase DinG